MLVCTVHVTSMPGLNTNPKQGRPQQQHNHSDIRSCRAKNMEDRPCAQTQRPTPPFVTYAELYWATPSPLFRGVCRNVPNRSSKKRCSRTAFISLSVPRCEKKRCCCCCYGEVNSQTAVSQAEDEIVLAALLSIRRRWRFTTLSTNKKTHNEYKKCLGSMPPPADNSLRG